MILDQVIHTNDGWPFSEVLAARNTELSLRGMLRRHKRGPYKGQNILLTKMTIEGILERHPLGRKLVADGWEIDDR